MANTLAELKQLQQLPLDVKIKKTEQRIHEWVDRFGIDGVYVSFSGGKDSTVLLDIVRRLYPEVVAVFVDTGLEYPEIREFVKTFDNVEWLRPEKTFKQVIFEYGYPFISKEVSQTVYYARKYMKQLNEYNNENDKDMQFSLSIADILGVERRKKADNKTFKDLKKGKLPKKNCYVDILNGKYKHKRNGVETNEYSKMYDKSRYKFFLDADFEISNMCCNVMKKHPVKHYAKKNNKKAITGQMATESRLRREKWLQHGCNGFDMEYPISNPMSFWTENDVLLYIKTRNIPICSVYGEVVEDIDEELPGQMCLFDCDPNDGMFKSGAPKLKTTGCSRTGCMFCGYGCHNEKGEGRFERMKRTHPKQYEYIMKPVEDGGLGYKHVIDWINEHGNLNIKY